MPDESNPKLPAAIQQARESLLNRAQPKSSEPPQPAPPAGPKPPSDKQRVLHVASQLFAHLGFHRVTLEEIARLAHVNKAALLSIAFSKEELLFQVLTREVAELLDQSGAFADRSVPVPEMMRAISEHAFNFIESRPLLLQLLIGTVDEWIPSWADRLHELRQRCISVPVEVLKIGMEQGLLRKDIPVDLVASVLFEIHVAGYLLHYRPGPELRLRAAQRRAMVLDILFHGLQVR